MFNFGTLAAESRIDYAKIAASILDPEENNDFGADHSMPFVLKFSPETVEASTKIANLLSPVINGKVSVSQIIQICFRANFFSQMISFFYPSKRFPTRLSRSSMIMSNGSLMPP